MTVLGTQTSSAKNGHGFSSDEATSVQRWWPQLPLEEHRRFATGASVGWLGTEFWDGRQSTSFKGSIRSYGILCERFAESQKTIPTFAMVAFSEWIWPLRSGVVVLGSALGRCFFL